MGKTVLFQEEKTADITLRVLSASRELKPDLDLVLSGFGLSAKWQVQHKQINAICSETIGQISNNDAHTLASALRVFPIWFELEIRTEIEISRYLFVPMLGLHRQVLSEAGEVLIRQGGIEEAIYLAKGNGKELERLLRKLSGQNHTDLLDQLQIERLPTISKAV